VVVNRGISVHVSDHAELVEVINDTKMARLTVILDYDIYLSPLIPGLIPRVAIPVGKDITSQVFG